MMDKSKSPSESKELAINYMEDPAIKARLNDIRRSLYIGGLKGLVQGISIGALAIYCTKFIPRFTRYYSKNNLFASVLITGTFAKYWIILLS